jgi:hypothetical protein
MRMSGKDGVRHYTSTAPARRVGGFDADDPLQLHGNLLACGCQAGVNFRSLRLNTAAYNDEIRTGRAPARGEEAIVRAIIHAESASIRGRCRGSGRRG